MTDNNLITQITDLVIQHTVNQKIPTLIFISDTEKSALIKNIIRTLKGGNQDESTFTSDDYETVSEIVENLAKIPLLIKETSDTNEIYENTKNFINKINSNKGLVIINNEENNFPPFTKRENISIIVVRLNKEEQYEQDSRFFQSENGRK